jgi:zinc transport system substrate-binding protein
MQSARLLLISGAGYEPWRVRVSLPESRLRDTSAGYADQFIRIPDAVVHQHGPDGSHSHSGTVWATWLDPELAASQIQRVADAIGRVSPEHADATQQSAAKLKTQLEGLNQRLVRLRERTAAAPLRVMADGPYYQYLTRRLDWDLQYLHWKEVSDQLADAELAELDALLDQNTSGTEAVFLLSAARSDSVADAIRARGLTVVRIDLCEHSSPAGATLLQRLESNVSRLEALGPSQP